MNLTVYKLLKGYLSRSIWLYAFLGLVHFLMTSFYWAQRYDRAPAVGVMLGIWGAAAALNANSLVWRSLPIVAKDASLFRWWAIAGAPGIYLTLLTGVAWASNRSSGFPTPAPGVFLEGIFAIWAVLGVVAVSLPAPRFYRRAGVAKAVAKVTIAISLLCYGVPVGAAVRPYSLAFMAAGFSLLVISAARGFGGGGWRWPDVESRGSAPAKASGAAPAAYRYGIWTVLLPLLQRTAIAAVITSALVVLMHFIFPRAGAALFWVYFIGMSTTGFLLTFQFRSARQALRCLPLSAKQLAGLLQLFGALPGLVTLGLTLLINRAVLNVALDFAEVATFAFVIISTQALPQQTQTPIQHNKFFKYWHPLFARIVVPAYLGALAVYWGTADGRAAWMRLPSVHWGFQAFGVGLCIAGYFILVQQLRSGIPPSGNENAFSQV